MKIEEHILFTRTELNAMIDARVNLRLEEKLKEMIELCNPKFCTVTDICREYHVSKQTVHRWAKPGTIVPRKIGGRTLFLSEEVEKALCDKPRLIKAKRKQGGKP